MDKIYEYEFDDSRNKDKYSKKYNPDHKNKPKKWYDNYANERYHTLKKNRNRQQALIHNGQLALPRQMDIILSNDQIRHKAIDFSVTEDFYKSSAARRYREYWDEKCRDRANPQNHNTKLSYKEIKQELSKYINLFDIYEHLYLSNINFAQLYDKPILNNIYKFDIIINLSGEKLPKRDNVRTYNYDFNDIPTFNISQETIYSIIEIINNAENDDLRVLINCKAGTNRSVFMAVTYAKWKYSDIFKNNKENAQYWINYIEKQKLRHGYQNWGTLTNLTFMHRLLYF